MSGAPQPPVIPEPFANNADPAFITDIPDTTVTAGRASYDLGFPPLTMQPVGGGGKPPFGQDMNGILFALSSHDFYVQAGQLFLFSSDVSTAIGGYAVGTLLGSTDGRTVWFNTADANTTDPDGGSAAGWVSLFSSGFQPFTGLTGGTLTLTATQAARKVITLAGVLTANLAVVLPNWLAPAGRWLFINNTTGAFNVTAKTAAGTGVNIPQGGPSNPIEVFGDGTNIYPAVSPLGVPISQAANPLTLVERDNSGDIFARFVNSNAGLENPTIGAVVITDSAADGYFRKMSIANFGAQVSLAVFAGQVSAAQVPLAAVIQYAANILASAALTGTPTAPTAASGTSTTQVASTAFANPSASLTMPGRFKLPSGHIVQYGLANPAGGTVAVALPVPYSGAGNYAVLTGGIASGAVQSWVVNGTQTASGFTLANSGGATWWATVGF